MFYGPDGRADPNGRFQLIGGRLKPRGGGELKPGEYVTFDVMLMDGARPQVDAKTAKPATIDEALRQRFAELAKRQGTDVKTMLMSMQQSEIDAETGYIIARARQNHDSHYGYLPANQRPAFTADQAAAAVTDALTAKVRDRAAQMVLAADEDNDPSFQQGLEDARRAARSHVLSNAWR